MTVLLVALGAAVGAPLRYLAGQRWGRDLPAGTLAVNVVGSFLLGLFSAWSLGEHALALLGTGFCGGLTTYSAFAVQTYERGFGRGSAYAALTIVTSLAVCAGGFWLGTSAQA